MSEKRFKSPIENALRGCQFWVKLGKNRWIFTPKERVLSFQVPDDCAKFRRNRFKIATVRARTHRQTDRHTHRENTSDLIICPMLCYSNGTDNYWCQFSQFFHWYNNVIAKDPYHP